MKQYLTDQNNKFDRLITKNLDIVLNGDITKDPNEKILQLIYENRLSIFNYVYKTGKNQLSTRLPYIPYFNPKSTSSTKIITIMRKPFLTLTLLQRLHY